MRYAILLTVLAVLAACSGPQRQSGPALSPLSVATADECAAGRYEYLVGRPDTALETVYILAPVRVLRPGEGRDRRILAKRLNFEIGRDGRIARVFCG